MCSHVVNVEVCEGATRSGERVQSARSVGGEHMRLLGAMLGQAVLGGAGLRGTALGRCPRAVVSVSETARWGVPLDAAQHRAAAVHGAEAPRGVSRFQERLVVQEL